MKYTTKQKLFDAFLAEWGEKFKAVYELEQFVQAYPDVVGEMEYIGFIKGHELEEYQLEWISLVEQFEHPLEKEFFKPYWVPLSKDKYEYFLDLSADSFCLFTVGFWGGEQGYWFTKDVIPNISEFLLGLEDGSIRLHIPTEDEDGNPIDENGNRIITETEPSRRIELPNEFIGYDTATLENQFTIVKGHFLESPIEERLIRWFNYTPVADNSSKPYRAFWEIKEKKLFLFLANAQIDDKQLFIRDIFPEIVEFPDEEYLYHYTSFNGSLTFVVDKITEPGYFSYQMNIGDIIILTFRGGVLTHIDKAPDPHKFS